MSESRPMYRPVSMRLWDDACFLACSDRGKLLWLHLLTCHATPISGVIMAGEAAMAEQLGWTVEGLREGWGEVLGQGLEARREGRLVWLPKSFNHQPPSSPNHLKSWAKFWGDIPNGHLKYEVWQALRTVSKGWAKLFAELFQEPSTKPSVKPSAEVSPSPTTRAHIHQHSTITITSTRESDARAIPPSTDTGVPATPPYQASLASDSPDRPYDPNEAGAKSRIAAQLWRRISDARVELGRTLGQNLLPLTPFGNPAGRAVSQSDALARVAEEGVHAPKVCEQVVDELIREARDTRKLDFLGEKSFAPGVWKNARDRVGRGSTPKPSGERRYVLPTPPDDKPDFGAWELHGPLKPITPEADS